jgi:hypothetical protein
MTRQEKIESFLAELKDTSEEGAPDNERRLSILLGLCKLKCDVATLREASDTIHRPVIA